MSAHRVERHPEATAFYEKYGFRPSPVDPMTLMITLAEARRVFG